MDLQSLALKVLDSVHDAGKHTYLDQINPKSVISSASASMFSGESVVQDINKRLQHFMERRLEHIDPCNGFWHNRPSQCQPWERYWCIGGIDGALNYTHGMPEWTITLSLFEFNELGSAQPIIGIVYAPALSLTYIAARQCGAIRIQATQTGERRDHIMPSTTESLQGSIVSYGMSYFPEESYRALQTVALLAGKPADIKRVGPVSLDLCKIADGTYDAYFEPHLHEWDVPAVSAGTVIVWEAQGRVSQWNGELIHWRRENDIVATNGQLDGELLPYLRKNSGV